MTNLYKLTKDGKCVGYLKIGQVLQGSLDCLVWRMIARQNPAGDLRLDGFEDKWIHFFDQAHPFVCEDKNGDKVFAGDKVLGRYFRTGIYQSFESIVEWYKAGYVLRLYSENNPKIGEDMINMNDDMVTYIELIKDKDNDSP